MKFVPTINIDTQLVFCKRGKKRHSRHRIDILTESECAECGKQNLTNENSDHMSVSADHDWVLLCSECADKYYDFYLICELTGA